MPKIIIDNVEVCIAYVGTDVRFILLCVSI